MQPAALEEYLHRHIPLSKAMGIGVVAVEEDAVTLRAPLAPNVNHRETVFGGSAAAAAMLAGWSLVHTRLRRSGIDGRVVIRRNKMAFNEPITSDFVVRAVLADASDWDRFAGRLKRKGIARITATAELRCGERNAAVFEGEFVVRRAADVGS